MFFSNHQVALWSIFLKFCQVLLWPPSGAHSNYISQQNGDETTRGRKKHLARFTKTDDSTLIHYNFHIFFPFSIELNEDGDELGHSIASRQLEELSDLNILTRDTLAILSTEKYLLRGESIFRYFFFNCGNIRH